jgi:hypothetical protein
MTDSPFILVLLEMEMTDSCKHTSLLPFIIYCSLESSKVESPGCNIKSLMAVINYVSRLVGLLLIPFYYFLGGND